ncbi:MAG: NAD(P)/FAD-dependent oxidoreductase [Promethearchaeota archaeon]
MRNMPSLGIEWIRVRLVIIGSGAAGLSAVQTLIEHQHTADVVLITKETRFYALFSLPSFVAGEIDEKSLDRFDRQYFEDAGIKMKLDTNVTAVNVDSNSVLLETGDELPYDRLLIATGASAIKPPIEGLDKDGVVTLVNLRDSEAILARAERKIKHAVIIGGGFVGLESATALHRLGAKVTIIEREKHLLPRMLDEDTAEIVTQLLQKQNVEVQTSTSVSKILGDKTVTGAQVGRKQLHCDLVVVAVGVRPNLDIIKGTRIKTNEGILVNEYMQTNVEHIYAAGDVAEALDRATNELKINAIWPNAISQGRIAAQNMLGQQISYQGSDAINLINIFETPVLSIGRTLSEIGTCEVIRIYRNEVYRKLFLCDGKVMGYQSVGDLRNAGFLLHAHRTGADISDVVESLKKDLLIGQYYWRSQEKQT